MRTNYFNRKQKWKKECIYKNMLKHAISKKEDTRKRLKYIQNQLKLPKDNRKLKNIKIDKIQPDFQM